MICLADGFHPVCIDDVTDDPEWLEVALHMVAESYAGLSSHDLNVEDVYDELCLDPYHLAGVSRTLLATGFNPNTDHVEALGTTRVTCGGSRDEREHLAPLEFMSLIEPECGWERFDFADFAPERAAEVSRFVVSPACRCDTARACGLPLHVTHRLIESIFVLLPVQGLSQLWALMPRYVARGTRSAGFELLPAPRDRRPKTGDRLTSRVLP